MKLDRAIAQEIQTRLSGAYGHVKLIADGHAITATVERVSKKSLRYGVVVYVDGFLRGEHLKVESEIGAKFYPLHTSCMFSAKAYAKHRKAWGKREADQLRKKLTFQYRGVFFSAAGALVRHLSKHCSSVELAASEQEA